LYALENTSSSGASDVRLSVIASQHDPLSALRDVKESGNAEESKGGEGVCQGARCVGVLLRSCIFILLFLVTMSSCHVWIHMGLLLPVTGMHDVLSICHTKSHIHHHHHHHGEDGSRPRGLCIREIDVKSEILVT